MPPAPWRQWFLGLKKVIDRLYFVQVLVLSYHQPRIFFKSGSGDEMESHQSCARNSLKER